MSLRWRGGTTRGDVGAMSRHLGSVDGLATAVGSQPGCGRDEGATFAWQHRLGRVLNGISVVLIALLMGSLMRTVITPDQPAALAQGAQAETPAAPFTPARRESAHPHLARTLRARSASTDPEAIRSILGRTPNAAGLNALGLPDFLAVRRAGHDFTILDTRERRLFKTAHLPGARNIPLDEIEQRAVHEVPSSSPVILFCDPDCACRKNARLTTSSICSVSASLLMHAGFKDVRVLDASLDDLRTAGIDPVASFPIGLPRTPVASPERARE